MELRYSPGAVKIEKRAESESNTLVGYASVFNLKSQDLGGFYEIIAPGAFNDVLENDVRALFNHNENFVLGRTKSGTLRLSTDETGLRYEIDLADSNMANDIARSVERGDIDGSSFAFRIESDLWEEDGEGNIIRIITKIASLRDVGPVTYPAYLDASVAKRSLSDFIAKKTCVPELENDRLRKELDLLTKVF
jgi:HK97 family phage prohead protease